MGRLLGRRAEASRANEEGFGIVELMAAVSILMIGVVALSQLSVSALGVTLLTRQREVAVAVANSRIEQFRASDYTNLANKTGTSPAPPSTYTGDDGVTRTVITSATGTVIYQQSVTESNFTFTVRQIVLAVDDSADGTGTSGANPDSDGVLVDYKKVVLELSSSTGKVPFTYKVESAIHDVTKDPVVAVQGIHVEVLDGSLSPATLVNDDELTWAIDVVGAGVSGEEVDEGIYNNFALPAGGYSCVVSSTLSTSTWHPVAAPTATSETVPCTVTAGIVTNVSTTWSDLGCTALAGHTGDLRVTVTSGSSGLPLASATVDPSPSQGQTDPAAEVTDANGVAVFSGVASGAYAVAASATGYTTKTTDACVPPEDLAEVAATLDPVGSNASTLNVTIRQTGATKNVRVRVATSLSEAIMAKNVIKTFTLTPQAGNYDVLVYCVDTSGKENLKKTWSAQSLSASGTLNLPGPTTATYQDVKC